jgi:hypothetical protein
VVDSWQGAGPIVVRPHSDLTTMSELQWFVATLVFEARVGTDSDDDRLLDHEVRLIRAIEAQSAYERALDLGRSNEHEYLNEDGQTVRWHFCGLEDLNTLVDEPGDGTEVFSWRSRGLGEHSTRPKQELSAFVEIRDADRTARDLLAD